MNIANWLSSPERTYDQGLKIFHQIKRSKNRDAFFASVKNAPRGSIHFNLLEQEIKSAWRIMRNQAPGQSSQTILPQGKNKPIVNAPLSNTKVRLVNNPLVEVSSLPENLQKSYFENQGITRELSGLHQTLRDSSLDDTQRQEIAGKISTLFEQRRANWEKIDQWVGVTQEQYAGLKNKPSQEPGSSSDTGQAPQGKQEAAKDILKDTGVSTAQQAIDIQQRIRSVKINISRAQKQLSQPEDLSEAQKASRKQKLQQWQAELAGLDQQLSTLTRS